MRKLLLVAMLATVFTGCPKDGHSGDGHDHSHGPGGSDGGGGTIAVPAKYADAVAKCKELAGKIDGLVAESKLADVHPVAADIKKIAESLAEKAQAELVPEVLKDVNVKATELAGMFTEIDKAADGGNKDGTVAANTKIKQLVSELEAFAARTKPAGAAPDAHKAGDGHGH